MPHRRPPWTRFRATFLLLLYLPACTSWQVVSVTPEQLIADQHPRTIRVERTDGKKLVIEHPEVTGDSIIGMVTSGARQTVTTGHMPSMSEQSAPVSVARRGIPLSEVHRVATRHTDAGKSVLAGLGITAVTLVIVAAVALATWDGPLGGCCYQ